MSRMSILTVAAALAVLVAFPVSAQSDPEEGERSRHLSPIRDDAIGGPKLPVVPPEARPHSGFDGFQLVGFSSVMLAGNRGILNMNLACREAHPGSRTCNVQEISQTIDVPYIPNWLRFGYAWVQSGRPFPAVSDCRGWTSVSALDQGSTIELGPEPGCYGGLVPASCDRELVVACCARATPR